MSTKENNESQIMPKEFPHMFTEVVFQLIPEINYDDLVYLSQLVKLNRREKLYSPLADTLRKIQWAKLASIEAITLEKEAVKMTEDKVIVFWPVGQAQYAKAICDFIFHTKSSLDSMAVFLTEFLSIIASGGKRDFKLKKFREQVMERDAVIGKHVKFIEQWFIDLQNLRDKWIHRISTRIFLASPLGEVGLLPIPKVASLDFGLWNTPTTKEYYWTTQEFIELNFGRLTSFFDTITARCIELESNMLVTPLPRPQKSEYAMLAFPLQLMENIEVKEIRFLK